MDPAIQSQITTAKIELLDELIELTGNRSCFTELRFYMKRKKFELENED